MTVTAWIVKWRIGTRNRAQDIRRREGHSRHPIRVHLRERLASVLTLLRLERTDEDTVGLKEVGDGRALSEELGVGEDVEAGAGLRVRLEDRAHRLGGPAWHRRLLDDDLVRRRDGGDAARGGLDVAAGAAGTYEVHGTRGGKVEV